MQDPSYMREFSRIPYKELEIDFLEGNGFVGYTFQYEGNNYSNKVAVKTKKRKDLVEAIAALFINAISSYENLNDSNKTTRGGTSKSKPKRKNSRKSK